MQNLVKQRLGLILIVATLLVIGITGYMLLRDFQQKSLRDIRADGETLTRILSSMPYEQLVPAKGHGSILQLLRIYLANSSLAYVAITDTTGKVVNRIAKHRVEPPAVIPVDNSSLWLSEQQLPVEHGAREIIEYRAPILRYGELGGHVHTAYVKPGLMQPVAQTPLLAQVALPIFLLKIFFYFLLGRELRPLQEANRKICELISSQQAAGVTLNATAELRDFIENFNSFMRMAKQQAEDLDSLRLQAQTSGNLLTYQKSRVESALQTLPDAIVIIDDAGTTSFANDRIESLLGIPIDSVIGRQPQDWCDNNEIVALLSQYHGNLSPLHRVETIRFIPEKYSDRTVSAGVFPLVSRQNPDSIFGTLVSFRDVTDQVMATQSRDEFITHVSHELKSPLNVIKMQAELSIEQDISETNEVVGSMNIIIDEVERLNILINDLLKITGFESGNITLSRQRVKLHEFLTDTFDVAMRNAPEKNLTTSLEIARSITTMEIDKELMRIALNNILSNAIKYSNPGGTVSMVVDEIEDTVQVQVRDSGIGISANDQKHIFEKFYRSEDNEVRKRSGHGLGLSLTREIIQLHGGQIEIESEPGMGTSFTISLIKTTGILKEAI